MNDLLDADPRSLTPLPTADIAGLRRSKSRSGNGNFLPPVDYESSNQPRSRRVEERSPSGPAIDSHNCMGQAWGLHLHRLGSLCFTLQSGRWGEAEVGGWNHEQHCRHLNRLANISWAKRISVRSPRVAPHLLNCIAIYPTIVELAYLSPGSRRPVMSTGYR
jgi:hypothetical protein